MTDTPASPSGRRTTWRERAFVLVGLALAALCTAGSPVLGTEFAAFAWLGDIEDRRLHEDDHLRSHGL